MSCPNMVRCNIGLLGIEPETFVDVPADKIDELANQLLAVDFNLDMAKCFAGNQIGRFMTLSKTELKGDIDVFENGLNSYGTRVEFSRICLDYLTPLIQ